MVCLIVSQLFFVSQNVAITGHHKDFWKPVIDETLTCDIELLNIHDPYVVKVIFQGLVVRHVPRFL